MRVMPCKNHVLYFIVTAAALTSLESSRGDAVDTEAFAQRPASLGRLDFRGLPSADEKHEPVVPTRHGSLSFKSDKEADKESTLALPSLEAKLKRLDPSVQCSDNLMTLKVKRAGAHYFLVDSGAGPLTPLSQVPSSCGFSVRRSRRDVLFDAPYYGCHVEQQGSDYVLPLRLWGTPMSMSCPALLPPSSVSCFPSGMVLKIGGITANGLKVKVSGVWMPLSSVCVSCGFAVEAFSGGLMLTAPYKKGLCIEMKDEEYFLSMRLGDVELLATCPSLPEITTSTTVLPSDSRWQWQFPQFSKFPQYPVIPVPTPPAQTPAPITVPPLPQQPQLPSGPAAEKAPAGQHPSFHIMPQYQQFPQFVFFPGPVPTTQSTTTKNTEAAAEAQLPQPFPQMPQYMPQYYFLPFPKPPLQPESQAQEVQDRKPVLQQPKPHVYPQTYQIPVIYPPPKY